MGRIERLSRSSHQNEVEGQAQSAQRVANACRLMGECRFSNHNNEKTKGDSPNAFAKSNQLRDRCADRPLDGILRAAIFAAAAGTVEQSKRYLQV
jgi:hypothetical protein